MSDIQTEDVRRALAIAALEPGECLVSWRYENATEKHRPVHFDDLQETMDRCNREFGDPARVIGGPQLDAPPHPWARGRATTMRNGR